MSDNRKMTVMSRQEQLEYKLLDDMIDKITQSTEFNHLIHDVVTRMFVLEIQANARIESILNLCQTGK